MELNELKRKIKEFDRKAGWDKTNFTQLLKFLDEELHNLKISKNNKNRVNHLLADILVLIVQLSYRYNTNFDSELKKWFEESKKYLK